MTKKMLLIGLLLTLIITLNGCYSDDPKPNEKASEVPMAQLIESIKERGVITPATVRQKEDGRYELISGHRRKRACELV